MGRDQRSNVGDLRLVGRRNPRRRLPGDKLPNYDIEDRREEQAKKRYSKHSKEHRGAEGLSHLGARAARKHKRQNAEDKSEACHENRAKPQPAGLADSFKPVAALVLALLREFHDEDGILTGQSYENDEADLRENIIVHATQPDAAQSR
jgi:hypothetical protein